MRGAQIIRGALHPQELILRELKDSWETRTPLSPDFDKRWRALIRVEMKKRFLKGVIVGYWAAVIIHALVVAIRGTP
jgi:hypothetical protein